MLDYANATIDLDSIPDEELFTFIEQLKREKDLSLKAIKEKDIEINRCIKLNEGLLINTKHLKETNENQTNLLLFYKRQLENSSCKRESKAQDSQMQKPCCLKENSNEDFRVKFNQCSLTTEDEKNDELIEQKEKLINMLTEKELEIIELKGTIEAFNAKPNDKDKEDKELKVSFEALELEYEQYKQKKEEQFEVFRKENEDIRSHELALSAKADDLEYENTCLKEEIQLYEIEKEQYDFQIKSLIDARNSKYDYQNEIEALQRHIRDLAESKEEMLISSSTERNNAFTERNVFEELYNQTKLQNEDLQIQLNKLKEDIRVDQQAVKDNYMKEINTKNKVIDQFQEIFDKKDEKIFQLENELTKKEQQLKEINERLRESQAQIEEAKNNNERRICEVNSRAENEVNGLQSKVNELLHQIKDCNCKEKDNEVAENITLIHALNEDKPVVEDNQLLFEHFLNEKHNYEKIINELRESTSRINVNRLIAEKNYLDKVIDSLKNQVETIKTQKENEKNYYESELKCSIDDSIQLKLELATISLEHDKELLKYKKTIELLKNSHQALGITITRRNRLTTQPN